MTESPDTEDADPFAGLDAGDLDRLVRRHAGARQRRRVERIDPVRYRYDEACFRFTYSAYAPSTE